jgi:hypothetical protein
VHAVHSEKCSQGALKVLSGKKTNKTDQVVLHKRDTQRWVPRKCWEEVGVTAFEHLSVYSFLGNCSINLCEQQRSREELVDGAEPFSLT